MNERAQAIKNKQLTGKLNRINDLKERKEKENTRESMT
jgi:hypothetical protein